MNPSQAPEESAAIGNTKNKRRSTRPSLLRKRTWVLITVSILLTLLLLLSATYLILAEAFKGWHPVFSTY